MRNVLFLVLIVFISSCGSTKSFQTSNMVPYAEVKLMDNTIVKGRIINVSDSTLTIALEGTQYTYDLDEIIKYDKILQPDPNIMQVDMVANSEAVAANTGIFAGILLASIIATAIFLLAPAK